MLTTSIEKPEAATAEPDATLLVSRHSFATADVPGAEQFDYWRECLTPIVDIVPAKCTRDSFHGTFTGADFNAFSISQFETDPVRFVRSADMIAKGRINAWLIDLRCCGTERTTWPERAVRSTQCHLGVRPMMRPYTGVNTSTRSIYLFLDRDHFADYAGVLDNLGHAHLAGTIAELFKQSLLAIVTHLPAMQVSEIGRLEAAIRALLDGVLGPYGKLAGDGERPEASDIELAMGLIQTHLTSRDLGVDMLVAQLGISRRRLYQMFEPYGGVATHIRRQRLNACRRAIESNADPRFISTIAFRHGFSDYSAFFRHFRSEFGYAPSEAPAARYFGNAPPSRRPRTLGEWLVKP